MVLLMQIATILYMPWNFLGWSLIETLVNRKVTVSVNFLVDFDFLSPSP